MLETGILVSGIIEQLVVEIHFDPAKYTLQPSAEQIRVIRKIPDDMNYLALLKGLEAAGMVIWKWQPNGDACIEVSYINTNAFSSGGPVLPFDTFSLASKTSAGTSPCTLTSFHTGICSRWCILTSLYAHHRHATTILTFHILDHKNLREVGQGHCRLTKGRAKNKK